MFSLISAHLKKKNILPHSDQDFKGSKFIFEIFFMNLFQVVLKSVYIQCKILKVVIFKDAKA